MNTLITILKLRACYAMLIIICISPFFLNAQEDKSHYSEVFKREKPYRIFLPEDYYNQQIKYPVIYYFHGNTENHELNFPGLAELVKEHSIILVAWNGRSVDTDIRPYNIGNHSNIKYQEQFKDYFPELVQHIDKNYRTLTDRSNRAVIGHSMGGIMSYFIAGKYPNLIGTAYNSKGSPEFFIGYPHNHSLFHVRYMFRNLHGVRLKFSTSPDCELYYLNNEVINGALHETGLDFSYKVYEGGHTLTHDQFRDAFMFVIESFKSPMEVPKRWHHSDLYPDFDIWDYEVRSNSEKPGFIYLNGVTKGGMGIGTKKWEPDGGVIPGTLISVKTAPLYHPNSLYNLLRYNETTGEKTLSGVSSDASGKISFKVDHERCQIGIFQKHDPPEITYVTHKVNDSGIFLDQNKPCRLMIRLLNRGGSDAKGLKVELSTSKEGVTIANPLIELDKIISGELVWLPAEYIVTANYNPPVDGSPFRIRFNLVVSDKKGNTWKDEFDAPVFFDVPEFTNIGIDDGDSEIFGAGNGNNIAEPGETVMIYEISNGSRRLRLYYDDPYIDYENIYSEIQPDKWGDGYSLSSLIRISEKCPPGHQIKFLASYEIKDWKTIRRDVTWGIVRITIGNP